ncbi:MAG: PaaI family thioesterase [Propionibacteriaceae bacterium]|nr:PaaI family thioesterase [Propionibacteriaceae bacterium]
MSDPAIQDFYDPDLAQCFGCGTQNPAGHHFATRWLADGRTETRFTPEPEHTAIRGFVYGGVVASLIDCAGTGSAALAAGRERGIDAAVDGALRFVTGTLEVRYERPTPMGPELVCTGEIVEVAGRKVTVALSVTAEGAVVATGRVIALEAPATMTV